MEMMSKKVEHQTEPSSTTEPETIPVTQAQINTPTVPQDPTEGYYDTEETQPEEY